MIQAYSWTIYQEEGVAEKIVDLSLILDGVTGIPKEIRPFFDLDQMGERKKWNLKFYLSKENGDRSFQGVVTLVNRRTRLTLESELVQHLRKAYPDHYQYFSNRRVSEQLSDREIKDVRIRLYKSEVAPREQVDSSFLGAFEISFPDSFKKGFQVRSTDFILDMEWDEQNGYKEGKKRIYSHYVRERDRRVVQTAIKRAKERYGKVFCEVCGFDFFQMYGEYGLDFIECHHTVPLAERNDLGSITRIEDIALLCSNCHRIVHRKRNQMLSVEQLKEIIKYRWSM